MKSALSIRRAVASAMVLAFVALAGVALAATPDQAPPVPPGQARVWFLRQLLPGESFHPPLLYVDGAPISTIGEGMVFYRDFAPGRYTFSVENCLPQSGSSQTMTLQPHTQYALQVSQDDNGAWDCNPPQVSYLQQVQPNRVPYLFAQVEYAGAR
ncbi:MAG TPA: hypothetical protein VME45_23250 [Stellaceae bacterium]|nr:hypothetical protein [Stellaceae bacterium]